jgi:RNA polymerase sigma factor (TIGR02999 family)
MADPDETTRLLNRLGRGERSVVSAVLPLIYDELRSLAARHMKKERPDHTLQPTALVHEAYLRIVDAKHIEWRGRSEFFALAAQQIRRVLLDHVRGHETQKRGSGAKKVTYDEHLHACLGDGVDYISLDDALTELARRSERQARVIELRFFAGMSVEDTAEVVGVSPRTVKADWRAARMWLAKVMRE